MDLKPKQSGTGGTKQLRVTISSSRTYYYSNAR